MGFESERNSHNAVILAQFSRPAAFPKYLAAFGAPMKLILLAATAALCLPLMVRAQRAPSNSVCTQDEFETDRALLTVCTHERGMAPLLQPRLFLRVYADGRGEYETDPPSREGVYDSRLILKQFCVSIDELNAIRSYSETSEFQNGPNAFPAFRMGNDSSRETTVTYRNDRQTNRIVLQNFWTADFDSKKFYPAAVFGLMETAELVRERAQGIVRPIPALSYCGLLYDRERYLNQKVSIYADLELNTPNPSLYDSNCDEPAIGPSRTKERLGVSYTDAAVEKERTALFRAPRFGGRARVSVVGILRDDSSRAKDTYNYRFEITEMKSAEPILLPYQGVLEAGWTYTDAFDHVPAHGLQLSSPWKIPFHHAARIEWANAKAFPILRSIGRRFITFRVLSKTTQPMGTNRWNDEYVCEIVELTK